MSEKLAIDFGTTNSVVARWDKQQSTCQVLDLFGMSAVPQPDSPPVIPSLIYISDGQKAQVTIGQAVRAQALDRQRTNRLFRNFKRGILDEESQPRYIDGFPWSDKDAGRLFVQTVLQALPYRREQIEQLVLTVPVMAFESYVSWLNTTVEGYVPDAVRIVDESTAAALGYAITEPDAPVMVFDFGGGSLDLSLVELPRGRAETGGFLSNLLGKASKQHAARVVAKSGLMLGGSDVDHWLLELILQHTGITFEALGEDATLLLSLCERAKIILSTQPRTEVQFEFAGQRHMVALTQTEFEKLLEAHGFSEMLCRTIDKLMLTAHRRGIYREDIRYVLLIGGSSLMPTVQSTLRRYFDASAVRVEKPFTAVAEGALQVALGYGLDDYLLHGYGLRCLDITSGKLRYEEVFSMGSRYPTEKSVRLHLKASHPNQEVFEFVIGEINTNAMSSVEVMQEAGETVFLADGSLQKVRALNADVPLTVKLDPPGQPGKDRLRVDFSIDDQLQLHLTVFDLLARKELLCDVIVAILRERGSLHSAERGVYLLAPEDNFKYDTSQPDWEEKFLQDGKDFVRRNLAAVGDTSIDDADKPIQLTGREPCFSSEQAGRFHVSLRGLAGVLGNLNPSIVPLSVAGEALSSPDFLTRYSAAELLSRRSDHGAHQLLEKTLRDGTAPQRASVARQIFRLPWKKAETLLNYALVDSDRRVRSGAISALCHLQTSDAYRILGEALLNATDDVRLAAAWGLGQNPDPAALPVLEIILHSQDSEVQVKVLEVLGAVKSPLAVSMVWQAIETPDVDVKYAAVLSLIELRGDECFPEVMQLIKRTSGHQRQAVLRGFFHATNYLFMNLGQSSQVGELVAVLKDALADNLPEARLAAAMPLIWMRHPLATSVILDVYQQEANVDVKSQMLAAAVNLMSPSALPLLEAAEQDSDPDLNALAEYLCQTRAVCRASV